MPFRGNVIRGTVRRGNVFGEMSIGEMFVGKLPGYQFSGLWNFQNVWHLTASISAYLKRLFPESTDSKTLIPKPYT